jgi:cystathionine beta-synthase
MGLALAAIVKVTNVFFVITDKQSKGKWTFFVPLESKVIVCPTDVEPTDERSYYS